jgi:hypothetical protein
MFSDFYTEFDIDQGSPMMADLCQEVPGKHHSLDDDLNKMKKSSLFCENSKACFSL